MSNDRSMGERLGDALGAAKSKVNEVADRTRAETHDAQAELADNPLEGAVEKGKAAVDRGKAGYHEARADHQAKRATKK
ncbi:Sec-independent protein translocase protein TatA [Deinobacterium chartae]|uniref:Sec-independent protein translocase protein TatA n=1 Tax=Deinobacterium chartae TaxID=521158 RepID=A0A841I2A0_9DEIO|nr:hypothetical protein [Deinobacterium chartae]MBB6098509.1 Sec-independent protein translocase protein TatA [Deinobacterium chartae]